VSGAIIAIVVVVVVVVAAVAVGTTVARRRRSQQLEERFGPEYQREIERTGDRREAERHLKQREREREKLDIRPLDPAARERYAEEWRRLQGRFVDAPEDAVRESDRLVAEVMRERGYPVDEFDRRASDISVDHPELAENYRAAHGIAQRTERGQSSTEELRQATVHYRSLFEELLETRVSDRHGSADHGGHAGEPGHAGGQPGAGAAGAEPGGAGQPPAGGGQPGAGTQPGPGGAQPAQPGAHPEDPGHQGRREEVR
jgi:hypothetical protein